MEAAERLHGIVDGVGRKESVPENAVPQARDLAIFMNFDQAPPRKARDLQADGVRSDIDCG